MKLTGNITNLTKNQRRNRRKFFEKAYEKSEKGFQQRKRETNKKHMTAAHKSV